jgi:hypothetical protein
MWKRDPHFVTTPSATFTECVTHPLSFHPPSLSIPLLPPLFYPTLIFFISLHSYELISLKNSYAAIPTDPLSTGPAMVFERVSGQVPKPTRLLFPMFLTTAIKHSMSILLCSSTPRATATSMLASTPSLLGWLCCLVCCAHPSMPYPNCIPPNSDSSTTIQPACPHRIPSSTETMHPSAWTTYTILTTTSSESAPLGLPPTLFC